MGQSLSDTDLHKVAGILKAHETELMRLGSQRNNTAPPDVMKVLITDNRLTFDLEDGGTSAPQESALRLDFLTGSLPSTRMKATVTSKGQITIPQPIRRKLKLHAGTVLEFDEATDFLKATKCADPARMRSVIGIAKKELAGKSTLGWLDELRGPVELPRRKRK